MKFKLFILLILLIVFVSSAWGFNCERRGCVLGGGLGFSPLIKTTLAQLEDKNSGIGLNLLIGHAWDDHNMLVYEGNVSGYVESGYYSDITVTQGFDGGVWYHYFGPTGKSAFSAVGIGLYQYQIEGEDAADVGLAILLGGGFEFARHWQVGGYLSFGNTSIGPLDLKHTNLNILISTVAF